MDIVRLHGRALDDAARLIDGMRPEHLGLPTPCGEWDVRALLAHLVGGNVRWAVLAGAAAMDRSPARGSGQGADLLGDDPAGAYRRSADLVRAAWRDPALLDRSFALPIGTLLGRAAINLHLVETVVHGWDLARATGQTPAFDPEVVRAATHFTRSGPPPPRATFAAPVPVADDLPEIDRLAALLGRAP